MKQHSTKPVWRDYLISNRNGESKVFQGVTLEIAMKKAALFFGTKDLMWLPEQFNTNKVG